MQVLHAVWDGNKGEFFVWAESSTMPTAVPKSRGRKPKKPKIKTHPFAHPATELRGLTGDIFDKTCLESAKFEKRTFLLPSTQKGPLPSPWLIRENEDDYGTDKPTGLTGWNIETLSFEPYSAFVFLIGLPEQLPRGFAFGSSLRFWIEAAKFSLELITRQQFTPAIKVGEQEHDFRAAWEAVITEEDSERVQTLAEAMPPSCRAFSDKDKSQLPSLSPSDMVLSFINRTVDAFIRESLASTSLLPPRRGRRPKVVPLLEQWLSALSTSTENTALTAPAEVLSTFYSEIQAWLTQLQPAAPDAPFRTCFRLEPPSESESEEDGTNWDVRFFLQAKDDRSLLVPAEEVWKTRSSTLTFLKRRFENPQEQLLADLANASRAFPAIETSLQTARPEGLELNAEQAYSFLRESAPLLEQSGFGVLLPSWWEKPAARMGVKLKLKPASEKSGASGKVETSGVFGVGGIITYDWVVAIGDETLSETEFEQLASLKVPLVQVRGQWVELRPEDVEAAIEFFKHKHSSGEMTLGEAMQLELGADAEDVETEVGLPVVEVEAEGWLKEMMGSLSGGVKVTPVKTPKTFNGELRPYQVKGVSWLAYLNKFGLGACLADDMGLGKCVLGDTLVVVNGILQSAEDIWNRYAGEVIFDGEGFWTVPTERLRTNSIDSETGKIVQTNIKRLYRQRVCERLRNVRLEDGSSVTITYRHKLLTNNGWTNDLHNGDYVCVPAKIIWDGKSEDHDLVKFLAWQIAEGYEHRKQAMLSIAQKDTERLDDLRQIIIRISKKYKIKINSPAIRTYADKTPTLVINSREYERFLSDKEYSWGQLSRGKTIPPFIMQADLDSVRVFLQNYFDAEGSAVQSMRSIEISTASAMLIQQLSYLLRRFGIWMHISAKKKRATNGAGIYRTYYIGTIGGNAARGFYQEIGFSIREKQQRLERICEVVSNTNVEGIPGSELVAHVVRTTKLPIRHFGMHNTVYINGSQQFSRTSLEKVIQAIGDIISGEAEKRYIKLKRSKWTAQTLNAHAKLDKQLIFTTKTRLQHLLDNEVYYCRIKEIEEVVYDGWVYDFEVEEHHNFIANNIFCHNTIELIALLLHERSSVSGKRGKKFSIAPTLLICPMSVVGNWQKEVERFAPSLKVMVHHGADRLTGKKFSREAKKNDLVISTYALAHRDEDTLSAVHWQHVVLDEAQNIKNPAAKQTQAIKKLKAAHRIALTGTPVENRLSELWSIMDFLNPGYLKSAQHFRANFALPIEKYRKKERAEMLRHIIQPFVLRRVKTDPKVINDLPEKMEMNVYYNLTREQASLYEAVVAEMLDRIENSEGIERKGLVLATLMKLKQICNHPALFLQDGSILEGRSGKLARLEEMLEEVLAAGDKALIFTQFAGMGAMLRHYLQEKLGGETLFLHGGTPKKQRDVMIQRFQNDPHGPPLFVLSLKAGGLGLNLTAANHVFHFDRWWNPAVENQATDRVFRIGQKKNVQVHKFVCIGTLEERIDQMIEQKKELADSIISADEAWLTELSTEQLKEVFSLSRDAVEPR